MASLDTPAKRGFPPVDDNIAPPETRYEVMDGELVYVSPAHDPHGMRHSKISALVEAHAGAAFIVASDMLTRVSEDSDVAPDVSVFPAGPDPVTGGRQLDQMAFEVVSKQSLWYATRKAAKLAARGVRRVFAIDVERERALEWSTALATWQMLDPDGLIDDPALDAPLPIAALLSAAKSDDDVARALIAKRNPEVEAYAARRAARAERQGERKGERKGKRKGLAEGRALGHAEAVLALLAVRGVRVSSSARARILGERDLERLGRWLARAATCATTRELFTVR
jgi:Uma2 family endonuclease